MVLQVQPHTSTTDLKDYSHLLLPMAGRSVLLSLWIYTLKKELAKFKKKAVLMKISLVNKPQIYPKCFDTSAFF